MKKIIPILFLLMAFIVGKSQSVVQRSTGANTLSDGRVQVRNNLFLPRFSDTSQANMFVGIDSAGAIIFTFLDSKIWKRNNYPRKWEDVSGSGNIGTVTSVGLTVPSAFSVSGSPITGSGTFGVTAIGTVNQYIRGNGTLASFPTIPAQVNLTDGGLVDITGSYPNLTITGNTPTLQQVLTQGSTLTGNNNINSGAFVLRINGTAAFGLPTGNTSQRPGSPSRGDTRINPDSANSIEYYNGTVWKKLANSGDATGYIGGNKISLVGNSFRLGPLTQNTLINNATFNMADSNFTWYNIHATDSIGMFAKSFLGPTGIGIKANSGIHFRTSNLGDGSYVFENLALSTIDTTTYSVAVFNKISGGLAKMSWPVFGGGTGDSGIIAVSPIVKTIIGANRRLSFDSTNWHTDLFNQNKYYLRSNPSGFITGNQSITLGGDVSGSGTTSITTTLASIITAGSCTNCNLSYDAKGRLTVAANGSGGTGGFNSNVGSAYRWAIPNTNNVKTYAVGYGLINDSATTNQLKTTLDSAIVYTYVRSLINSSDSITVVNSGATGEQFLRAGHDTLFANKLKAGTNVTLTRNADSSISIASTGGSGITNVFKQTDSLMKNTSTFWGRDSVIEGIVKKPVVIATPANIRSDAASLIEMPDKSWMIAYTAYANNPVDAGSAVIAVRRSTDYGATWSAVDTAVFNTANGNYIPSLYLRNDGTIVMLYDYQPTDTTSQIRKVTLASPYTVGTWSAPSLVFGSGTTYFAPGADRILKTHRGALLYPYCVNTTPSDLGSQTGHYRGRLLVSYNDGTSWSDVSTFNNGSPDSLCGETGVYQIDDIDQTIWYYYRTRSNDVYAVKSTANDTTYDQTTQIAMGIGAPNTLTSIKYSAQHKTAVAIHNSLDANFDRMQMYMSTSQDNLTWTRKVRLDSLTGYKFYEPFLTFINNEVIAGYSRIDVALGDTSNLYTNRIPFQYIQSGAPYQNTFNNLVVDAGNLVDNPNLLEMYYRKIPRANAYVKLQNITQGYSVGGAWFRIKNSGFPVLWDNNVPTNTDAYRQNAFWGTSTNVGNAYMLHEWQNNGTWKARIAGNGNASFVGTLTAAGTDSVGTPINSLWMDAGGTIHKGVSAAGGISGTTNRIIKFTSSTTGGNSTASDDGSFFTIPALNVGVGTAVSGWDMQVQGSNNTSTLFTNIENNNHTNIFRAIKQRTLGSFILNVGDPVFSFDGQGGVGTFNMEANNELGSDNYTNLDLVWKGRQNVTLAERMRVTGEGRLVLSKKSDGSNANMFSMTLADIGHGSAYFDIDNVTTAGSAFSPYFRIKASGIGFGALWDINTTGNNGVWVMDARNGASSISAGNDLFLLSNNSATVFNMHADGKTFFKDSISSTVRGGYTTNINSTLGLYSWPTKRYVDSLVGTVGGTPTLQSVLTADPNISSNTTSTFGSTSWTLNQNSTGRLKLNNLKQDAIQFLTGHAADSSLTNVTAASALSFLGIDQGTYVPTTTNVTNISSSSADSAYWTIQGGIVTVFFSVTVTTTLAAASELGISLPPAYVSNTYSVNLLHGSGNSNSAIATNITLEGDVGNARAKLSFTGLAVSGNGKIKGSFRFLYQAP